MEDNNENSFLCKLKVTGSDDTQLGSKIKLATETGVRKQFSADQTGRK